MTTILIEQALKEEEETQLMWSTTTCNGCGDVACDNTFYYVADCESPDAYCDMCVYFLKKTLGLRRKH